MGRTRTRRGCPAPPLELVSERLALNEGLRFEPDCLPITLHYWSPDTIHLFAFCRGGTGILLGAPRS